MPSLGDVVRGLAARDGIEGVLMLSADGLPIEHAGRTPFEPETLAALTATLTQYANRLGLGTSRGSLRTAVIEYERALLVVALMGFARKRQLNLWQCLRPQRRDLLIPNWKMRRGFAFAKTGTSAENPS